MQSIEVSAGRKKWIFKNEIEDKKIGNLKLEPFINSYHPANYEIKQKYWINRQCPSFC